MVKAEQFDAKFDNGEDIMPYLELDKPYWPNLQGGDTAPIELPVKLLQHLDSLAERTGQSKEAVIITALIREFGTDSH